MKTTKRLVALLLVSAMLLAAMFAMVACEQPEVYEGGEFDIKVWVSESEGVKELTIAQIARFNETNEYGYTFNATVEGVSESESSTQVITDVETAPDVYCFAQDQTARLVQAGALAQPGVNARKEIEASHDAGALKAVNVGGKVRAYPLTSDNGYFLMYDKRVINEDQLGDLAALVKACEDAGKNFSMEVETSAWYLASFFFGVGCHSEWVINDKGKPTGINDDFNSDKGIIAMKAMQILTKSSAYHSSSSTSDFGAAVPSAVVVSGTWAVEEAEKQLGKENLGFAPLPSFTVDGKTYHMGSFSGNKLMGVKPQKEANKAAGLSLLARYLTNEECQLERFNAFNWGPSNLEAQKDPKVLENEALAALAAQNNYGTPQGNINGSWWDDAKLLGTAAREAELGDVNAFKTALNAYVAANQAAIDLDEEALRAWTIIGSVGGTSWNTDFEMIEDPDNTWISKDAFTLDENSAWVFRKGSNWDYKVGVVGTEVAIRWGGADLEDGNVTLEKLGKAAGTYKMKLVLTWTDDQVTAATIELIPQ